VPDPILSTSDMRRSDPEIGSPAVTRARRGWLWAALPVCAGFALFGIIVWLAYKDTSGGPPLGEPPLIRAAADPIKLPPEQAEETEESTAADSGAIGRLWGDAERADQPERLLPLPEEPLSPPVVAAPDPTPGLPSSAPTADGAAGAAAPPDDAAMTEAEAALDRLLAEVTALSEGQGAAPGPAESGSPAETPPTAAAEAATEAPTLEAPAQVPPPEAEEEATAAAEAPDATPSESQEIRQASALSAPPEAPEPSPSAELTPAPPAAPQVAAVEDRYRVQLAAVRAEADARRAWDLFQADLGDVLRDVQPFFERAETANGIFYRVQIGPFASQATAESRCEDLKQRNASCFVIRR